MNFISKYELVTSASIAAMLVILAFLGVTEALGAHPWWATKVAYFGIVVGAVAYFGQTFWRGPFLVKSVLYALVLLAFSATAWVGKMRFVNSYADDVVSGRMWYLGWIGAVTLVFILAVHLVAGRR